MRRASRISVFSRVQDLPAQVWGALRPGPFRGHRWLRLLERTRLRYEPRYVVLRGDARWLGVAVCLRQRQFHLEAHLGSPLARRLVAGALARWPVLTCGLADFGRPGVILAPGAGAPQREALARAVCALAARERLPLCGWTHLSPTEPLPPALAGQGALRLRMRSAMRVELADEDLQRHLLRLPRRHRSELRRGCNRAREAGVTVEVRRPTPRLEAALAPIRQQVMARHHFVDPWVPDIYLTAQRVLGSDFRLLVAERGGPIACLALLRSGDEVRLKWAGVDHARARPVFAFHALMVGALRQALDMGARTLNLGPPDYALKRAMGARPAPLSLLLRSPWPGGGGALRCASRLLRATGGARSA